MTHGKPRRDASSNENTSAPRGGGSSGDSGGSGGGSDAVELLAPLWREATRGGSGGGGMRSRSSCADVAEKELQRDENRLAG